MKYQNKLKLKYTLYSILGIFTNLIILSFARLFEREIEVLITMICFFLFRKLFEKQYHCKTLLKCSIVSIAIFSIVAIVQVDKSISILLSIILSFVITFASYFVKDYIDKYVIVRKLNSTIANTYLELSIAELNHIDKLHSIVILLIDNVKDLKKSIPIGMNEIWQWEHEKIVEKVEELRFKISKFKSWKKDRETCLFNLFKNF